MTKVLYVASEAYPLMKTGGLADVAGSLPVALKSLRCDVRLLIPAYPDALSKLKNSSSISTISLPGLPGQVNLIEAQLPDSRLKVWLVDYPAAFERPGNPYLDNHGNPWPDNAERFSLLCKVAHSISIDQANLNWQPDIVHCNDWQTGLIAPLLHDHPSRPATIFTIHNLAYQGLFSRDLFLALGLAETFWTFTALEFHGQLSFIKGGLNFADRISTVSPRYAAEIQTPEFGCGLDGLLRYRSKTLTGIINGIDNTIWNPATDKYIEKNYDRDDLKSKAINRQALQKIFNLAISSEPLLIGFIGRLVDQKGIDIILDSIDSLVKLPIQLVILGTGKSTYENALIKSAKKYSSHISVVIDYDEALAHKIEAGADAFLMPSKFEPCGLNQLYSLKYGTLPIVHQVGGLADTVTDISKKNLAAKIATGITIKDLNCAQLFMAVERTLSLYNKPRSWKNVMRTAMAQEYDWQTSAKQYIKLYREAIAARTAASK
jgi:starch synthase